MTRPNYFHHPLMLGFDRLEESLERMGKSSAEGYPPYNIEDLRKGHLRISLALAGFCEEDLEVLIEGNKLVIQGKQREDKTRVYLYKGIAARQFQRTFVLADGLEVEGAFLENGLLHIDLARPHIEPVTRSIRIEKAKGAPSKAKRLAPTRTKP